MTQTIGEGVIRVSADTTELKAGIEGAKRSVRDLGGELGKSTEAGSAKAQRSIDAYIAKIEQSVASLGKSRRELVAIQLQQRGATDAQLKRVDAALQQEEGFKARARAEREASEVSRKAALAAATAQRFHAGSIKLTAQEAAQLSFQLNDLAVQVASGGNPMIALLQQGSQLSGTFGGVGNSLRVVASMFTLARVAAAGLAGAAGTLGFGLARGNAESAALARTLLATGNAAGLTEGKFNELARAIADKTSTTIGSARDTLLAIAAGGQLTGEALEGAAEAALLLSKITGQSADEIAADFTKAADSPAKLAEQLNKTYNFLSGAQLRQIRQLEDQGATQQALAQTFDALNSRIGKATEQLGYLERAWAAVRRMASEAGDAITSAGRSRTIEEEIEQLEAGLRVRKESGRASQVSAAAELALNGVVERRIELLKQQQQAERDKALASAKAAETQKAQIEFGKREEASLTQQQRLAKEVADANALADKAGIDPKRRAAFVEAIRQKYAGLAQAAKEAAKAQLEADRAGIERATDATSAGVERASQILEAQRAAQLITEQQYYDGRRNLIEQYAQTQAAAIEAEIALLQRQKIVAKDADDAERQRIEKSTKIADLQARLVIVQADATAKATVLDTQREGTQKRLAAALEATTQAHSDYLAQLLREQDAELAMEGRGDRARQDLQERLRIAHEFARKRELIESNRRQAEFEGRFDENARARYDAELGELSRAQAAATAIVEEGIAKRRQAETVAANGSSRAIENYLENARDVAGQTERLYANAFQTIEDALVQFVTTGKLSFKSLATSILADIARIVIKAMVLKAIMALSGTGADTGAVASGSAGVGDFAGGFAAGGTIPAGKFGLVGEKGPELISGPATITPLNSPSASGGGVGGGNVTFAPVFHIDARSDRAQVAAIARAQSQQALVEFTRAWRASGRF